jgi:hypothetical protein
MTVEAAYDQMGHTTYQNRVRHAILKAAVAIRNELDTTPLHAERVALAREIARNPAGWAVLFGELILTNGALLAAENILAIPQGDIEFAVNERFNTEV